MNQEYCNELITKLDECSVWIKENRDNQRLLNQISMLKQFLLVGDPTFTARTDALQIIKHINRLKKRQK